MTMRLPFCIVAILLLFGGLHAAEPSWPVFHGPKGDNISPDTGLLKSWPEGGPKLLWKADKIGTTEYPGYSSVVIGDGCVFTTGNVKMGSGDKPANDFVYCLDLKTGKELWKYDNGPGWTGHYPGDRSTPTLDGDRLYALSADGMLTCLKAKSGEKIWACNVRKEYDAALPKWAYAESVVVDGDKVVCWPGGKKASVVAFNKLDGMVIWETPGSDELAGYGTMLIFEMGGRRIYVSTTQHGFLFVDAKTGENLLFYEHKTQYDINATIPYFDAKTGKMFLTSGYGTGSELIQLKLADGKLTAEQLWANKKFDNQHGGVIIRDGIIYGAAHHYKGGIWMALKWENGEIAWENKGPGQGCCSFADGLIYAMGEKEGIVALIKPNAEKYEEISRFTLPEGVGMYWAHPVICGGKLFLRHGDVVYCYDITAQ